VIAVGRLDETADRNQGIEAIIDGGAAGAAQRSQLGKRQRLIDAGQRGDDAFVDGCAARVGRHGPFDNVERHGMSVFGEFECQGRHRRRGPVLDGQGESVVGLFAQIEIGVAPSVEFGRAAQRLAGADAAGALLGVMNDQHRDGMAPLQFPQISE
jgi:hypothetical protein